MNDTTTPSSNPWAIPAAIVVAGALIALALYFGRGSNSGGVATNTQTPPPVPTVGPIREVTADRDHIRGAATAQVTIIEYSDLECPFCKQNEKTLAEVLKKYPNDVRVVYRHFPLEGLHQQAKPEAVATECAGEQGKFWEMVDTIFKVTPSNDGLDLTTLPDLAKQSGVANGEQFTACLKSGKYDQRIQEDSNDATIAGGRGTPHHVFIGPSGEKRPVSGAVPLTQMEQIIKSWL